MIRSFRPIALSGMFLGTAAVLVAVACNPSTQYAAPPPLPTVEQPAHEPLEMKTYAVDKDHQQKIASVLRDAFRAEEPIGRVTTAPGNRLVVVAPRSMHQGVASLLDEVKKAGAPAAPDTVEVTYWLVLGRPTADEAPRPGGELAKPLAAIIDAQGDMEFELLERLTLRSLDSNHAESKGRVANIRQTVSTTGSKLIADVAVSTDEHQVQTRLSVAPGQFVVLGQVGFDAEDSLTPSPATLFYVVRAEVAQ